MPIFTSEANPGNWSTDPKPIYLDDNITVYAFPVYKQLEDPNSKASTSSVSKRKRDTVGEDARPKKRANTDPSPSPEPSPPQTQAEHPATHSDLRISMIQTMFPASKAKAPGNSTTKQTEKQQKQKKGKGSKVKSEKGLTTNEQSALTKTELVNDSTLSEILVNQDASSSNAPDAEPDIYKRAAVPPGYHSQLPKFESRDPGCTQALVIVGPRVRGRFDTQKAEALNVPNGSIRGKLTKGETIRFTVKVKTVGEDGTEVETEEERTVRPEDVLDESEPPGVVIVLDIPTTSHISSLISTFQESLFYQRFRSTKPEDLKEHSVRTIYHLCGKDVLEDPRYTQFMKGFPDTVHHVVSSPEYLPDPITFTSAAYSQLRLNKLDPQMFPLPKFSLRPSKVLSEVPNLPPLTHPMTSTMLITVRPPGAPQYVTAERAGDLFHPSVISRPPSPSTKSKRNHGDEVVNMLELPELTEQKFEKAREDVRLATEAYNKLAGVVTRRETRKRAESQKRNDEAEEEKRLGESGSERSEVESEQSEGEEQASATVVGRGRRKKDPTRSPTASPTARSAPRKSSHAASPEPTPEPVPESTAKVRQEKESSHYKRKGKDIVIAPLGTGSAIPTKYRNVSSTLIQVPYWGNILLDAGEGTWGQLTRKYGLGTHGPKPKSGKRKDQDGVWEVLRNLKCLYVSHIHADHHMGVVQILEKRKMLDPPPKHPLFLITVRSVHLYLRERSDITDLGLVLNVGENDDPSNTNDTDWLNTNGVIPIMSEALLWRNSDGYLTTGHRVWRVGGDEPWTSYERSRQAVAKLCDIMCLQSFTTVDVRHRTKCFGPVIKHKDGWSIVFSGDTLPTNSLVHGGQRATLLIHEATMADDQEDLAKKKAHSTVGQALEIGRKMRAENILLTHFSARYPKMPPSELLRPPALPQPDESSAEVSTPDVTNLDNPDVAQQNKEKDADTDTASDASSVTNQIRAKSSRPEPFVALAFDHAHFKLGDMWKFRWYIPAIEQSFEDIVAVEGEGEGEESTAQQEMDVDMTG
ncbi:hypothetical protein AX16_006570 [Volvariella volvacea WC 439]|nr:hypothetical protein AX16_006570 [Volvariella volvacea WC 439]